jgi:hypothetical protein
LTAVENVANETEAILAIRERGIRRVVTGVYPPHTRRQRLSPIAVAVPKDRLAEAIQVLTARETESPGPDADEGGADDPKRVR